MNRVFLTYIKILVALILVASTLTSCGKIENSPLSVDSTHNTANQTTEPSTTVKTTVQTTVQTTDKTTVQTTDKTTVQETTTKNSTTTIPTKTITKKKTTNTTTTTVTTATTTTTETIKTTKPSETTTAPPTLSPLQSIVRTSAEKYGAVGIQTAIISNGQISDTAEYGWAVLNDLAMTNNTKIRIASLSKTVVGMVTFRLIEQGVLDLNADISNYIGVQVRNPHFPDMAITLKMLLTHTSSLADASYVSSLEELQNHFLTDGAYTKNKPGEKNVYNNFAFGVIGTICEVVTSKSLTTLANEYFFNPMEIVSTYVPEQLESSQMAVLYRANGTIGSSISDQKSNATFTDTPGKSMKLYAGGLTICAADYAKLLTLFMNGGVYNGNQLLSQSSINQMQSVVLIQPETGINQCIAMFKRHDLYGESLYYHTGSAYGVYALYTYNPEKKIGVVVITTGAKGTKDSSNIYAVCGDIARGVYEQNLV